MAREHREAGQTLGQLTQGNHGVSIPRDNKSPPAQHGPVQLALADPV